MFNTKYIDNFAPYILSQVEKKIIELKEQGIDVSNLGINDPSWLTKPMAQIALSPKDIVWRKNKSKLYRYVSVNTEKKYRTPILLLYALINKPYILDLAPGISLIEHLVNQGFDVYLLDWGEFELEDKDISVADLVIDYIAPAARKVSQFSQNNEITLMGYCQGGTFAAMYAALFNQPIIKNIVYLASPIDFSCFGISSIWFKEKDFDPDKVVDAYKLVPSYFIDSGIKMYSGGASYMGVYARLLRMIDQGVPLRAWQVLEYWLNDSINFPGVAYRQWVKDFYQDNKLINNKLILRGRRVSLNKISASSLTIVGSKDHIALPEQVTAALEHTSSSDTSNFEFPLGHVGLVLSQMTYPTISQWLADRSDKV